MGRPRELTEEEREKLIAEGYRPVEAWMPDIWSDEVWEQVYRDCELIRSSEDRLASWMQFPCSESNVPS